MAFDTRALLDLIAEAESGANGYLAVQGQEDPAPLEGMTVSDALLYAETMKSRKDSSGALGRYQIIPDTLKSLIKEVGLKGDEPFTPDLQDALAQRLLMRRGLNDYTTKRITDTDFANRLSQEWAGLPAGSGGKSFYEGVQGNKARVPWDRVVGTLAGKRGVDARMAATNASGPPGDPVTGLAAPSGTYTPTIDPRPLLGAPRAPQRQPPMDQQSADLETEPLSRPKGDLGALLLALGAGIASNPSGPRGGPTGGVLRGIGAGMSNYSQTRRAEAQADAELYQLQLNRQKAKREQKAQAAMDALPEPYRTMALVDPAGAVRAMSGGDKPAEVKQYEFLIANGAAPESALQMAFGGSQESYGAPTYLVGPDGSYTAQQFSNRGRPLNTPVEGTPYSAQQYSPSVRGEVAQNVARGTATGTAQATAQNTFPRVEAQVNDALTTINRMIAHPGRAMATGKSSMIPRIPGTEAYNYAALQKQAVGQVFLTAFERLKGAGQITEIEGQKATEAITNLDLAQTEEQHLEALYQLKGILATAMANGRRAAGQPVAPQSDGWSIEVEP